MAVVLTGRSSGRVATPGVGRRVDRGCSSVVGYHEATGRVLRKPGELPQRFFVRPVSSNGISAMSGLSWVTSVHPGGCRICDLRRWSSVVPPQGTKPRRATDSIRPFEPGESVFAHRLGRSGPVARPYSARSGAVSPLTSPCIRHSSASAPPRSRRRRCTGTPTGSPTGALTCGNAILVRAARTSRKALRGLTQLRSGGRQVWSLYSINHQARDQGARQGRDRPVDRSCPINTRSCHSIA